MARNAPRATRPHIPGYGIPKDTPEPKNWAGGGLVAVRPTRVFAWRFESFNTTATRFHFG